MNKNIVIPDGWFRLLAGTTLKEGDKFWSQDYWSLTGDSGRVIDPVDLVFIRECESKTEGIFNIGDKVIVGGKTGTIHSPRMYLITDYGYLVKFNEFFDITNGGFTGISQKNQLLAFRESLIKLVPKTKKVKLNADYSAEIFNDKVVVGCQTIPYSVIQEIVKAHDSI